MFVGGGRKMGKSKESRGCGINKLQETRYCLIFANGEKERLNHFLSGGTGNETRVEEGLVGGGGGYLRGLFKVWWLSSSSFPIKPSM